jgi:23S rRNA pseudouridine1911/1915/1917 synthase
MANGRDHRNGAGGGGAHQRLIIEGRIKVNGSLVKPNHAPHAGDVITIHWPSPTAPVAQAQDIPLEVLFEDEDLIVINIVG